jgi:hypothetical protein
MVVLSGSGRSCHLLPVRESAMMWWLTYLELLFVVCCCIVIRTSQDLKADDEIMES